MKLFRSSLLTFLILATLSIPLTALRYKYDYDLISDIRKTYVLLYKFRLFYHASASAYFNATRTGPGRYRFGYAGVPDSGYRIRTHRNGDSLSVVTAAPSFAAAKAAYPSRIATFRREAPFYAKMIKRISRRPFRILPASANALQFYRNTDGTYDGYGFSLKLIKPDDMPRYGNSFNIYKLLLETVKGMSHKALPGKTLSSLPASTIATWKSPWLNYSKRFTTISLLADYQSEKYIKYHQPHSFRLTYRVLSRRGGRVTIMGAATPMAEIGMDMKIRKISRYLIYRERDGILIRDKLVMKATTSDGIGWTYRSDLSLL